MPAPFPAVQVAYGHFFALLGALKSIFKIPLYVVNSSFQEATAVEVPSQVQLPTIYDNLTPHADHTQSVSPNNMKSYLCEIGEVFQKGLVELPRGR
ncbi:uncharacterized protein B0T23DRAFT_211209 [Neurospora hispaniola]|uniref:Uncharacterized protein n=1 Tax=Neurospora hispaniola TaxID=588809 RepID=A0AAJ0I1K0_9PEZI|nr:hypothetical protein B0T23DRAFT_211209 [Neurospora hispaniola]